MSQDLRIPVTILTGFLGSGKTTLLQKLLKQDHGKRIAVIENEYGALGLDHALLQHVEENIILVQNGCICCTVRKDLVDAIIQLHSKKELFDSIVIETTGLADPSPIIQTLLTDPVISSLVYIDTVVTVVDAVLFESNFLDKFDEFQAQIGYADLIVLSKTENITISHQKAIVKQIETINVNAKIEISTMHTHDVSNFFGQKLFFEKPIKPIVLSVPAQGLIRLMPEAHPRTKVFSRVFNVEGRLLSEQMGVLIQSYMNLFSDQVLRLKGVLFLQGDKHATLVQAVKHIVGVQSISVPLNQEILNQIVIISKTQESLDAFEFLMGSSNIVVKGQENAIDL